MSLTREIALKRGQCALLVIDMQRYCAEPGVGCLQHVDPDNVKGSRGEYLVDRLRSTVIPALQKVTAACRQKKVDVIYTYIECLTKDGRDQSLDYKLSGFHVPKGSPYAAIVEDLKPDEDDILLPKTSCSVFNSTVIEYILRNMGVEQLMVTGMITNQCVESAVRDAADRGFLLTLVEDACAAHTQAEHDGGVRNMRGFARVRTHEQLLGEIGAL